MVDSDLEGGRSLEAWGGRNGRKKERDCM